MEKRLSFKGIKWLLAIIFYLQFLVIAFINIIWSFLSGGDAPQYLVITGVTLLSVLLPLIAFVFINSADFKSVLKLNKTSFGNIFLSLIIGLSLQPVAVMLNDFVKWIFSNFGISISQNSISINRYALIVTAILPAVIEELLFRGALLTAVEGKGYRFSIFITSFLFALMHNDIGSFAGIFILGVVSCYAVWMTNSVFCGMAVHFAFNGFNILIYPFLKTEMFYALSFIVALFVLIYAINAIFDSSVKRIVTYNFWNESFKAVFNLPILLVILGFIFFK